MERPNFGRTAAPPSRVHWCRILRTDLLVMMMAMMIPMMALLMELGQYTTHRQLLGYMFGRVAVCKDASACDVGITQGVSLLPPD